MRILFGFILSHVTWLIVGQTAIIKDIEVTDNEAVMFFLNQFKTDIGELKSTVNKMKIKINKLETENINIKVQRCYIR